MRIGIPAEIRPGETRVAATPETVKKLAAGGKHSCSCSRAPASAPRFRTPTIRPRARPSSPPQPTSYAQSDIVLKVRAPDAGELPLLRRGAILIGLLNPYDAAGIDALAKSGVTGFAMEWLPRTTRAQSMDVLSSQANIAGYKAVDRRGRRVPAASCRC